MEEDSNKSTVTSQSTENTTTEKKQEKPSDATKTTTTKSSSSSSSSSKSHSTHHTRRKKDSEVGKRERKLNPIYADFAVDSRTMQAMTANRKRSTRSSTAAASSTTKSTSTSTSAPAKKKKKTSANEAKPSTATDDKKSSSSSKRSHKKAESAKESKKRKNEQEKDDSIESDNNNDDDDEYEEPSTPDQIEPMSPLSSPSSSTTSQSSHQHTKSTKSSNSTKKETKLLTPKKEDEADENKNENGIKKEEEDVTMKEEDENDEEEKEEEEEEEGEEEEEEEEDDDENDERKEGEGSTIPTTTVTMSSSSPSPSSSQQQIKQEKEDNQPKQKTKSKSKKKGSIDPDSPEWIRAIYSFIKALMKLPEAGPFLDPVDPVALCIPDYFDVIKEPMDLGTIRQKIEASSRKRPSPEGASEASEGAADPKLYNNLDDVSSDIRLVFSNAKKYNPPGHNVHDYAAALGNVFERRLSKIEMIARNPDMSNGASEYKWLHLEVRRAIEEQTRKIREMKHAEELRQQQIEHQQKLNLRRIADGILTPEQKRLLVEKISKQKGRELTKVVDVLKTYSAALRQSFALAQQNSEFVVEVDLERLPNPVLTLLWRLMFPNDSTFSPMTPSSPALASSPGMDQKKKKKQSQPHSSLQQSVELEQNKDFQDFTLEKDKNT